MIGERLTITAFLQGPQIAQFDEPNVLLQTVMQFSLNAWVGGAKSDDRYSRYNRYIPINRQDRYVENLRVGSGESRGR